MLFVRKTTSTISGRPERAFNGTVKCSLGGSDMLIGDETITIGDLE